MIYEARPNVTADAFGLCFKTGNAVILKGGSDALHSNKAVVECIRQGLLRAGLPETAVQLIESGDREVTREFMRMNRYLDVLIPRGGRADPHGGGEQHRACHRDRDGQLPYLCG